MGLSIIPTTVLLHSWSFASALFFLFFFSFQISFLCHTRLEISKLETSHSGTCGHEWQGHLERELTPLSFFLTHPSLYPHFTPSGLCWKAWNSPGKVTPFDSAVSLNYVSAFISKSKYKRIKKKRVRETAKRHGNILQSVEKSHFN
jgi:hypothetical protein